jgi:hypothetical protein
MPIKIKTGTVHKNEKETRQRNTKTQLGTQKEERKIVVWSLRPSLPTNKLSLVDSFRNKTEMEFF